MLHTMISSPEYWQAVAQGIDAEETKATLFIKHNASVGAAREEILKEFLRRRTPEPFRVRSGFIHRLFEKPNDNYCSRQLDVLVYDASIAQPDYEIGELVLLPGSSVGNAAAIVEAKTMLDNDRMNEILVVWDDVSWLCLPTFGFAFDGVQFHTFVEYLSKAIRERPNGLPECIAVHRKNYLFVRSYYRGVQPADPCRHRPADLQLAVNFGEDGSARGRAAGTLLHLYLNRLKSRLDFDHLSHWFNKLDLPEDSKLSISDDGEITRGNCPDH
jgi:hypothetical protein